MSPLLPMVPATPGMATSPIVWWGLVTGPVLEPLTVQDAKKHARIVQAQDDEMIARYIKAARETAEDYLGRGLYTQTWQVGYAQFFEEMFLPRAAPLQNDALATPSTAPVVQYYDSNGALQTLPPVAYIVDTLSRPGRIVRAPNLDWPSVQNDRRGARVVITYVIGWKTLQEIPERIKQGIRLYLTYLDSDRDGLDPNSDKALQAACACWADRVRFIEPTATGYWTGGYYL